MPLSVAVGVINLLGLPGLIFIVWHFDQKKHEKLREQYKDDVAKILGQYKEDVSQIKVLYENNVTLIKNYERSVNLWERLASELSGIIQLNTQAQTNLVGAINNNHFCPKVREETGK
jgi:endo-1,4-beta-mannosidase